MIHYTIIPLDVVFEGYDQYNKHYEELSFQGVQLQVERLNGAHVRVERLISSDPEDFLNPLYAPGNVVDLSRV